jgi:lactoylglutathione lyase
MITCAQVITVYVSDQQAALNFWRESVGFEVRDDAEFMPQARWVTVAPAGAQTAIALWPIGAAHTADVKLGGFTGISFGTRDIAGLFAQLGAHGVNITQPPEAVPWGISGMFADPDGNQYNVVEQPAPA